MEVTRSLMINADVVAFEIKEPQDQPLDAFVGVPPLEPPELK
jgi:hypothetical protein